MTMIGISPCAGFLTPDAPQKGIALPSADTKKNSHPNIAMLVNLDDKKKLEFDADPIKGFIPALFSIAGQNKLIEIRLSVEGNDTSAADFKVVGFVYPAP